MGETLDGLIGRTVGGTYRVESKLGEGGMGAVFKALDVRLDRPVALKVMRPEFAVSGDFSKRFQREARVAAKFRHARSVDVYAFGEDQGLLYMALELVDGRDLATLIAERGKYPIAEAVRLVLQVLDALDRAHALEIVHRDLKPQNIMVSAAGDVKILDFGIAKMKDAGEPSALTRTGTVMGTLAYMSPEQAGGDAVDGRSDLYSVGVILFEMLVGEAPFRGTTAGELMKKQLFSPPPRPRDEREDIPLSLEAVILRALEKDPAKRFKDARTFSDALQATIAPSDATCAKCASRLPEGSAFCNVCGTSTTIACPACGRDTAAQSRFCTRCGVEVAKAKVEPPEPAPAKPAPAKPAPPQPAGVPTAGSPIVIVLVIAGVLIGLCLFATVLAVLFG